MSFSRLQLENPRTEPLKSLTFRFEFGFAIAIHADYVLSARFRARVPLIPPQLPNSGQSLYGPIDNNVCERILKAAIRHRDNSLFYKTLNGAKVGDFFMGVIQTCRLNGKDPFHYLTTIRRLIDQVRDNPALWMPWNYQAAIAGAGPP